MPIRNIERDLYSKKSKASKRKHANTYFNEWESGENPYDVNKETWKQEIKHNAKNEIKAASIAVVIVSIFVVIGVAILGYVAYQKAFFNEDNVELNVNMPSEIESNKPMEIEVQYRNDNRAALKEAEILVSYGQFFNPEDNQKYFTKLTTSSGVIKIGEIPPKTSGHLTIVGHFSAPQNEVESIHLELKYVPEKSNEEFSFKSSASTRVVSAPIDMNIITEKTAVNGNVADIIITYNNKSSNDFENVIIKAKYPKGFILQHTEPNTNPQTNDEWSLSSLKAGTSGQIKLRGVINGEGKKVVKFNTKIYEKQAPDIFYGGATYPIKITSSPLLITQKVFTSDSNIVSIGGSEDSVSGLIQNLEEIEDIGLINWEKKNKESNIVYSGSMPKYDINLKNNGSIPIRNIILTAKIDGEVVDFGQISVENNGYFNLSERLITWKASDVPELEVLNPGDSVSLSYSFQIKDFLPKGKSNFSVSTVAFADSLDLPTRIRENKNASSNIKIVNVGAKVLFNTHIKHISGPNPPIRGEASIYRVTMEVGSINNDLKNISIKGSLPTNVEFVGQKEDDVDELEINRRTNIFVWNVGNVDHGTGVDSDFKKVSFDVKFLKNAINDNKMTVVKNFFGSGYDGFVNQKVFIVSGELGIENL